MLNYFRLASLLEGISFLLILSVTIGFISREWVFMLGMLHGVLFLAYIVLSLIASHKQSWSLIIWLLIFLASVTPLGFIAVEFFIKKQLKIKEVYA
jgi:integral membrane protein